MKVLIITHDFGTARAYSAIVRSGGWTAMTSDHAEDVVSTIQRDMVDAVILDYAPSTGADALCRVRDAKPVCVWAAVFAAGLWRPAPRGCICGVAANSEHSFWLN